MLPDERELGVEEGLQPRHVHVGVGCDVPEPGHGGGESFGHAGADRYPQPRPPDARRPAGQAHSLLDPGQEGPRFLEKHGARVGQSHALPAALQQRGAHHFLEAANLLAERRLRDKHPLRRLRECAGIGHRDEITQVPELNAVRCHSLGIRLQHHEEASCRTYWTSSSPWRVTVCYQAACWPTPAPARWSLEGAYEYGTRWAGPQTVVI